MYELRIVKTTCGFDDEFAFKCTDFEEVISIMRVLQNKIFYFEITKEE